MTQRRIRDVLAFFSLAVLVVYIVGTSFLQSTQLNLLHHVYSGGMLRRAAYTSLVLNWAPTAQLLDRVNFGPVAALTPFTVEVLAESQSEVRSIAIDPRSARRAFAHSAPPRWRAALVALWRALIMVGLALPAALSVALVRTATDPQGRSTVRSWQDDARRSAALIGGTYGSLLVDYRLQMPLSALPALLAAGNEALVADGDYYSLHIVDHAVRTLSRRWPTRRWRGRCCGGRRPTIACATPSTWPAARPSLAAPSSPRTGPCWPWSSTLGTCSRPWPGARRGRRLR